MYDMKEQTFRASLRNAKTGELIAPLELISEDIEKCHDINHCKIEASKEFTFTSEIKYISPKMIEVMVGIKYSVFQKLRIHFENFKNKILNIFYCLFYLKDKNTRGFSHKSLKRKV